MSTDTETSKIIFSSSFKCYSFRNVLGLFVYIIGAMFFGLMSFSLVIGISQGTFPKSPFFYYYAFSAVLIVLGNYLYRDYFLEITDSKVFITEKYRFWGNRYFEFSFSQIYKISYYNVLYTIRWRHFEDYFYFLKPQKGNARLLFVVDAHKKEELENVLLKLKRKKNLEVRREDFTHHYYNLPPFFLRTKKTDKHLF